MEKNHHSSREITLNCFPYSAPERISGTSAQSFEFNQFYEDQNQPIGAKRAFAIQDNPVTLETATDQLYDTLHPRKNGAWLSQVSQIVFEGRRPLCDFGWAHWIVVDRVVSQNVEFSKPYGER